MKFYVIESHSLVIGWSPKCACTAATDWIVNGILKPATPIKKEREYLAERGYAQGAEKAAEFIFEKGFKPVFFTRDPMARIASAFVNKFICRSGRPLRYPARFEQFALNFIDKLYRHNNYSGEYEGLSFVDFINYIEFSVGAQRKLNGHWAPQISGLTEELKNLILSGKCFVVKQESFEHDLKNVNYALGFDYLPGYRNVSQWPEKWSALPQDKDCSAITNKKIIRRKIKISKDNLLTDNIKATIACIYHDDFKLFSYSMTMDKNTSSQGK